VNGVGFVWEEKCLDGLERSTREGGQSCTAGGPGTVGPPLRRLRHPTPCIVLHRLRVVGARAFTLGLAH
jgi:hypothetical protein